MKLFVGDHCPRCTTVKNFINVEGIEILQINDELIAKYGLTTVPSLYDDKLITNIQEIIKKVRK